MILSPSRRITSPSGPMKTMPMLAAKVGKFGVLGYKAPANPDRFGARCRQRRCQPVVVDIAALELIGVGSSDLSGAEEHRLVRFADEHGMTVGIGEERDGAQATCRALD